MEKADTLYCNHERLLWEGAEVCRQCGEVLQTRFDSYNNILEAEKYGHNNRTFIKTKDKCDIKGNPIKNLSEFRRIQKSATFRSSNTKNIGTRRIEYACKKISKELNLPSHIMKSSLYVFKRLKKKFDINYSIKNIFYCMWEAICWFKHSVDLQELINTFKKYRHNEVTKKTIMRNGSKYRSYILNSIYKKQMKQEVRKKPTYYLPKYINASISLLKEDKKAELIKHYGSLYIFSSELESTCCRILQVVKPRLVFYKPRPHFLASTCIYSANLIMSIKNGHSKAFTQETVSQASKMSSFSLRGIYKRLFYNLVESINNLKTNKNKNICICIRFKEFFKQLKRLGIKYDQIETPDYKVYLFYIGEYTVRFIKRHPYQFEVYSSTDELVKKGKSLKKLYQFLKSEDLI